MTFYEWVQANRRPYTCVGSELDQQITRLAVAMRLDTQWPKGARTRQEIIDYLRREWTFPQSAVSAVVDLGIVYAHECGLAFDEGW